MGLLYTNLKIFHHKEKIDSLYRENPYILSPVHVRIKPTNICNHNCKYCAYRSDSLQLGKDMVENDSIPKEKMFEIIDDLAEMKIGAVTFSGGGEPFCYKYFLDVVKKLSLTDIQFASLTNGSRLKGEIAEIFAHKGSWIRVSMDGWNDESYSTYRNIKPGAFSSLLKNMEEFKKISGGCLLGVSIIVDKKNSDHLYELIKKLKNTGADSVKISPCIIFNDGKENNLYHRSIFKKVKESAERAVSDFHDDSFEIYDSYHLLDEKFQKNYDWCPYLQILPVIGADSNIYSCQDKAYNLENGFIGSVKEERFKDFWFNNKSKFFTINPTLHCNHYCVANQKNQLILEYLNAHKKHLAFV